MELVNKIIGEYTKRHHRRPAAIYATPVALAVLAVKNNLPETGSVNEIPIYCTENPGAVTGNNCLGLDVKDGALRAYDL